jgi:hypothetical protein
MRACVLLGAVAAGILSAQARQMKPLTSEQMKTLALNSPQVLRAAGCCPEEFGPPTRVDESVVWIMVRCGCTDAAGQLVDNFTVNPLRAEIREGLEPDGPLLRSKRLDALRRQLIRTNRIQAK